ncbi:putative transmembrane protein [Gregarina niphandrodes]|uniref:Transmembrane protein n=1 Tax=Gregarina niphandrodes TaxID=110365 RepID=A0A023AYJ7_GRENI|nr:putative transmembrane protein [Gregarina niphandrodes]EZG43508.1 putative transmembrane protein [Gregarina niphandrodes]|eukprot:XP_011133258.1 putative transmembrane protein [Gregarina niphandrodes]
MTRFRLVWFILTALSLQLVPVIVLYNHGLRHVMLDAVFGVPCVVTTLDVIVALLRSSGRQSKVLVGGPLDVSETEKLLNGHDLLSTGTDYGTDYMSGGPTEDDATIPITIFSTPPPAW